jgi:ubiquinone/menaquinone biosynthesis C-methylase UbiE
MMKVSFSNLPAGWIRQAFMASMKRNRMPLCDWAFSHVQADPDSFVLDLACRDGISLQAWLNRCPDGKAAGIDPSAAAAAEARKRNREAIRQNRCMIREGDVSHLPFMKEMFDWASVFDGMYFWEDPDACFTEIRRVLKPSGRILIGNSLTPDNPQAVMYAKKIRELKLYDPDQLRRSLMQAGFTDVKGWRHRHNAWICLIAEKPQ